MAEQQIIDGRRGRVVHGEYGTTWIEDGPPPRPELPREESGVLTKAALLKRQGWTDADFVVAQLKYGLPEPQNQPRMKALGWMPFLASEPVWPVAQIDAWRDAKRDELAELAQLIGEGR